MRPSSLADFQAFLATSITYGTDGDDDGADLRRRGQRAANAGNLIHHGTANANLYAEGTVTVGGSTLQNGAKKYDSTRARDRAVQAEQLRPVPFTLRSRTTIATVTGAADSAGGIDLPARPIPRTRTSASQSPAYKVDAWKLVFQSNGTVARLAPASRYNSTTRLRPKTCADYYVATTAPVRQRRRPHTDLDADPSNGAIYSAADVIVSGVVQGQVTVATAGNIIYGGNMTYNAERNRRARRGGDGDDRTSRSGPDAAIRAATSPSTPRSSPSTAPSRSTRRHDGCSWTSGTNSRVQHLRLESAPRAPRPDALDDDQRLVGALRRVGRRRSLHGRTRSAPQLQLRPQPALRASRRTGPTLGNAFTILVQRQI